MPELRVVAQLTTKPGSEEIIREALARLNLRHPEPPWLRRVQAVRVLGHTWHLRDRRDLGEPGRPRRPHADRGHSGRARSSGGSRSRRHRDPSAPDWSEPTLGARPPPGCPATRCVRAVAIARRKDSHHDRSRLGVCPARRRATSTATRTSTAHTAVSIPPLVPRLARRSG